MNDLMTKSFTINMDSEEEALKNLLAGPDFDNVKKVKEEMSLMRNILDSIQEAHDKSESLHKSAPLKEVRLRINTDILNVLKMAKTIRSRIQDLDKGIVADRRLSDYAAGTPLDRARTSVTNGLRQKLRLLMMEFQDLRQKIMNDHKDRIRRWYFTVEGEYPEEEVIEKIMSNNGGEDFLQKAVQEHGKGKVLETVVEIQEDRHDAVKEIEKSLLELNQVFLDMAVMVEAQDDHLDNIEHHVTEAVGYAKDGSKKLRQAKNYQILSQIFNIKLKDIAKVVVPILVVAVAVPFFISFRSSEGFTITFITKSVNEVGSRSEVESGSIK